MKRKDKEGLRRKDHKLPEKPISNRTVIKCKEELELSEARRKHREKEKKTKRKKSTMAEDQINGMNPQPQNNNGVVQQPQLNQGDVALDMGVQIPVGGANYWANAYEAMGEDDVIDIHDRQNPIYMSRVWPGRNEHMTAAQWLEVLPKIKALAAQLVAEGHQLLEHADMDDFNQSLDIVFTDAELNRFQGRFGDDDVSDHCEALEWLASTILNNGYQEKWIQETVGAAMTMHIRRGRTLRQGNPNGRGPTDWVKFAEAEMNRDEIELLGLRLGQAMRNEQVMRLADLGWIGMESDDTQAVCYWRTMIGSMLLTKNQARVWKLKGERHIQELEMDPDMLIGPQDFSELRPSSRGWGATLGSPDRFSNGQGVQKSLGETILSAALGKEILRSHRYMDEGEVLGTHNIMAANSASLKRVGGLMFLLGQYSKRHFTWSPVGRKFSMVVLMRPQTNQVIGALPMLERGPATPGFAVTMRFPRFEMEVGKKYLKIYGGHQDNELIHPIKEGHQWALTKLPIQRNLRNLSAINRDPWTV